MIGAGFSVSRRTQGSPRPEKDRSLKGAVQDVIAINEFLSTSLSKVNTTILTASKSHHEFCPTEIRERLPTPGNVYQSFERILTLADANDCVYIHYSAMELERP